MDRPVRVDIAGGNTMIAPVLRIVKTPRFWEAGQSPVSVRRDIPAPQDMHRLLTTQEFARMTESSTIEKELLKRLRMAKI